MTDGSRVYAAEKIDPSVRVPVENPHVVDLRGQRTYTVHRSTEAREHASGEGMRPIGTLTRDGWTMHVEDWRSGAGLVAICPPSPGRNVLLIVEGGGYLHWSSALAFLPLYKDATALEGDGAEDLVRAWAVVSRMHQIALGHSTHAVATKKTVAHRLVDDLGWALLPAEQAASWRAVVREPEHAQAYWQAGMTPQHVSSSWGWAERDHSTVTADQVASLFQCGVDATTAGSWLRSLSWTDEWPGLIKAGWTARDADALVDASWAGIGGKTGKVYLADIQRNLRKQWVAAGLRPEVAIPAMVAGLSLDEALAPDLDLDVLASMAALRHQGAL